MTSLLANPCRVLANPCRDRKRKSYYTIFRNGIEIAAIEIEIEKPYQLLRKEQQQYVDWAHIDDDVLEYILKMLPLADILRCRGVCTWWRSVSKTYLSISINSLPKPYPPLIVWEKDYYEPWCFFDVLRTDGGRNLYVPNTKSQELLGQMGPCVGSSSNGGYLLFLATEDEDNNESLYLFHPMLFSGSALHLPLISNPYGTIDIEKAVLWGDPISDGGYYGLVVLHPCYGPPLFAKCGATQFTPLECRDKDRFLDIICVKNRLYGLIDNWNFNVWDCTTCIGSSHVPRLVLEVEPQISKPFPPSTRDLHHLVESEEEILLVVVDRPARRHLDHHGGTLAAYNKVFPICEVYKMHFNNKIWERIYSLGDRVLFVTNFQSFSVSSQEFPQYQRNSIYFWHELAIRGEEPSLGIFNMEDGSLKIIDAKSDEPSAYLDSEQCIVVSDCNYTDITCTQCYLSSQSLLMGMDLFLSRTFEQLWNELAVHQLLPRRYHAWYSRSSAPGGDNKNDGVSFPLSYNKLVERYPHIEKDHLVKLLKQLIVAVPPSLNSMAGRIAPRNVATMLGAGSFSFLDSERNEINKQVNSFPSYLRWPHSHADQVHGLSMRAIGGFRKHHRAPSIPLACYTIIRPSTMVQKMQNIKRLRGHRNAVYCAIFDRTGRYVITGSDDRLVKIWSMESAFCLASCRGHEGDITDLAVSSNNFFVASASNDYSIRVWQMPNGFPISVLRGHSGAVTAIAFSPRTTTSHYLLSSSDDGTCRIWNARSSECLSIYLPKPSSVISSFGMNNGIRPSNVPSSSHAPPCHQIICCAFNANGSYFVTGSSDTMARVWSTGKSTTDDHEQPKHEIDILEGHENDVNYVQFSACAVATRYLSPNSLPEDNRQRLKNSWFNHDNIVTCSRDGSAIIWVPVSRKSHGKARKWRKSYHLKVPPPPMPPQPSRGGPRQRRLPTPRGVNMIVWSLDDRFVLAAIMGKFCREVTAAAKIAFISDESYIGCGICVVKKCPFEAIQIINLPKELEKDTTHR